MTIIEGDNINNPAESELLVSVNRYQSLLEAVNGIVWEADADTFEFTFISDSVTRILGYTKEEWMNTPLFWTNHIYHEDRENALAFCRSETLLSRNHSFDYRMVKANGDIVWIRDIISVALEDGKPKWLRGIMVDVTEARLLADLEHLEKEVLALNAQKDTDIERVLCFYVLGIEKLFPQMKCSVLRVTDDKLNNWASPSLPLAYTSGIREKSIGPLAGSCGAAAYRKQMVIVNDIEHDKIWAEHKQYALAHNLRASWSYPIINSRGIVIATFGIYYHTVTDPNVSHVAIIERSAGILKIILENREYAEMMREANALISQGQALANFGTWQWDIANDKATWSDVLYRIYGLDPGTFKPSFEGYLHQLHPDDRNRVRQLIGDTLESGKDVVFEERIVCPDGQMKYLKSWARVVAGDNGKPVRMIGACLDITHIKTARLKMDEIAWLQSHVIRAPLARLIGLVSILEEEFKPTGEHLDILGKIIFTARELDEVIREISANTRV